MASAGIFSGILGQRVYNPVASAGWKSVHGQFQVGPWLVDPSLNIISRNGTTVHLEPKMMEVLVCLATHAGEALPKAKLLQTVWPDTFVTEDALKRCIFELRRVLEDDAREPHIIQTIPKRGYRLVAPVEPVNGSLDTPAAQLGSKTGRVTAVNTRKLRMPLLAVLAIALLFVFLEAFNVGGAGTWLRAKGTPQIHSLAVLPLRNLSSDPNQEYFSDGMTDALITDLAQIDSVKVISRTSSMQYKQTRKSLPEIARELNVDGIVEGTVQRSGDRVRITAQLIQGPADKHLWANSYEQDVRDVFALERSVTEDIARHVRARLTTSSQAPTAQPRRVNPDALEAYLRGNYYLSKQGNGLNDEALKKAQEYFQQAIDADPNFAPAYVGLANAHIGLLQGSNEDWELAEESAKRAIELDPTYSDAHDTLGWLRLHRFWDWTGAEEEFRKAIAFNPSSADGHQSICYLLGSLGRLDEALKECQIAQELDPNQDRLSEILYIRREYDRAIEQQLRWISRYPDNGVEHHFLFHGYWQKGMHKEAIQELEQAVTLFGSKKAAARIHQGFAISGYEGAIRVLAREIEHQASTKQAFLPLLGAETYTLLGNKDRAFYWLEQAYQHPELVSLDDGLMDLKSDPMLDPLRSDPRYKDLLRRVRLPQ
jgi:TolB-like protein/DNA-binding winged helix-turn-helix (wHTH) protein/Tfp pilus assembly protein PilF